MSLSSLLSELPKPTARGPRCSIGLLLDQLQESDPKGAEALRARLDDGTPALVLSDALMKAGHAIKATTVRRHRKRGLSNGCACE